METNPTGNPGVVGLIPGLHQWVKNPALLWLWLWFRPAAVALIQPVAWELPYAMNEALKRKKKGMKPLAFMTYDSEELK